MSAQKTLATVDQLPDLSSRLSAEGKRCERVKGELIIMSAAGGRHGRIANTIAFLMTDFNREERLGTV
jgi:Uma2 family endonuclease